MKTAERETARALRREEGESLKEIARRLNVSVSSVSLWVRDIELTSEQHEALRARNPAYNAQLQGSAARIAKCRARRRASQEEGRRLARLGEPLHMAGCMLFWAEGSRARNAVRFSNSDPGMARLFIRFLRTYFAVDDDIVRVTCNLFADHRQRQEQIEQFWLDTLELPRTSLCKSTVNVHSKHSKRKRLNMLPYGTVRIAICRTAIVQSLYGSIQEYGGFERPEWLD